VRVGLRVPQYAGTWPDLRDAALLAERLGFAHLWVNDHLQTPGRRARDAAFEGLTTLAALAPLTSRARLGVAVLSASYRHPALAAKIATVLDVISGGRLIVGLGAGSDRDEHAAYGFPFTTPKERTATLGRAVEVMRAMWDEPQGASVEGVLRNAPNLPRPAQRPGPPLWLAAHGPALLRLAGRKADGIVAAFLTPEELSRRCAIAQEARGQGRPPLDVALYAYALPVESRREALSWLRPEADALGTTPERLLRWVGTSGIVGSGAELCEALRSYSDAGATDAILVLPNRVPPEATAALAEAVLSERPRVEPATPRSATARHNLAHLLVDRWVEDGHGGDAAVIDETGRWTYAELARASGVAAGALARRGARRGDRVMLAMRDGRLWCSAFLGAARMGAVPVPTDPLSSPQRLAQLVDDCEPSVVVAERETPAPASLAMHPSELEQGEPAPTAAVHPADLAYLVYSSGSTGRPKAVLHAHRDMAVSIEGYAREILALGPGERSHSVARLFTSLGFGNGFFRVLGTGATCVLTGTRPTVRTVLDTLARHEVTLLTAVPTFWLQLATFLDRHPDAWNAPSLRLAVSSGDSLPATVAERVRARLHLDLIEGFGCSECSNVVISTRPGAPLPGMLGTVTPGVEVLLADDDGRPVAPGQPGRLHIASESNTSGYWRRIEETRDLVHGRWIRMGDVLAEEDGVFRHLGRADDLFKVDARWVSPTQVEAALLEHPSVADAAVVGAPDRSGLVRPAAFVVLGEALGGDVAEVLRRHVAHRLEPHAAPASVAVVAELPRLPGGKLDRRALKARLAG
jgi:acyl-coenzyme A synthetase/AMP-(fatty) acid ligase/alkanesulfonate monooxygenase SsuD/methylene tetrahydromethanopterin reductase-like flavin-dependent oxidoreductase (luciferase family)